MIAGGVGLLTPSLEHLGPPPSPGRVRGRYSEVTLVNPSGAGAPLFRIRVVEADVGYKAREGPPKQSAHVWTTYGRARHAQRRPLMPLRFPNGDSLMVIHKR